MPDRSGLTWDEWCRLYPIREVAVPPSAPWHGPADRIACERARHALEESDEAACEVVRCGDRYYVVPGETTDES